LRDRYEKSRSGRSNSLSNREEKRGFLRTLTARVMLVGLAMVSTLPVFAKPALAQDTLVVVTTTTDLVAWLRQ
jgi:hypothetical protein